MSRNWTENQKLAIEARSGSLLVSAAAGSGKTAVLVERVIRMVTDSDNPVPIDRLLIVTYTRAAASELRERISKTLCNLISENPHNSWYRRQLVHLPAANISTVDSFCGELVREFFQNLSISADYRIADSGELSILKQEAVARTLDEMYEEGSSDFYSLVEAFSTARDDTKLQTNILRLYEFLRSHPFSDSWLKEKLSYYSACTSVSDSIWGRVILDYVSSAVDYCKELTESSLKLLESEPELMSKVCDLFYGDLKYLNTLSGMIKTSEWDDISRFASSFVTGKLIARGYTDHPVKLRVASNRKILRDILKTILSLFEQSEADCLNDINSQYPIVKIMFRCVTLFDKIYSELKLERNIADFPDVEHWALELLVSRNEDGETEPTDIAKIVSKRFDAVMVDEYQDANEVQDLIFNSVSNNGANLFVVGDVKQSIYGFRQAMPEIFLSRKNSLPLYNPEDKNYPAKVILERNFRSRREVTDFVNFTFTALMSVATGDLEYTDEERLVPQASYPEATSPCVTLDLIDLDSVGELDAVIAEARHIAAIVYEKCSNTLITDSGCERKVNFGDIAVLMRNLSRYGDIYVNELKRLGVPAVCESSSGFLTTHEVKVALNYLRVIDNPVQDIPLLSVLMSPLYGFTPDDMALIRSQSPRSSLYMAVKAYAEQGDKKSQHFLSELEQLRNLSLTMPSDLFINTFYEHTGFLSVSSVTGGELAVNNLRLLSEYATNFERGSSKGISAFVSYLDRLERDGTDLPAAVTPNADALNAVRIMTIHSSKGLEFPVCILTNTARKFLSDASENVLLHSKLGFASKRRDNELLCSYNTLPRKAVALEIKRSEMSEELRVLYVAMTRAKEHLIMIASKKNLQKYVSSLSSGLVGSERVSPFVVRGSTYLSDWLVMCGLMHPNGKYLRSYAGVEEPESFAWEDTESFTVNIVDSLVCSQEDSSALVSSSVVFESVPENIGEILKSRFDFEYPDYALCNLPQKVTASELAHKDSQKHFSRVLLTPAFLSDTPLSAAQRGIAMHTFLERCDYLLARKDIVSEIQRLESKKILTPMQAKSLDVQRLQNFINSDIITLLLSSDDYFREYRFTVNIPASMIDSTLSGELASYPVILQGSIDLAIITKDGIIIVDYKTDRVHSADELRSMYSKQLLLYKEAIQQTIGKPVIRCLIYSVYLSEVTEVM
ncbi:MAG: helicase-exonuclease AddAB subunit AddA [Clostridia bacterium]|nr:helicase-exonuclease AddAB subunit AddA [Clostridia bacterium]